MNLPFKFARRYIFSQKSTNAINIISGISVFGICIGSMALIVIMSVFNGFEGLLGNLIGNFKADENGDATISISTDEWCIGCGDETKDIIGKGIIVHAGLDDFTTQPTGDAGGRVSCGGIIE